MMEKHENTSKNPIPLILIPTAIIDLFLGQKTTKNSEDTLISVNGENA